MKINALHKNLIRRYLLWAYKTTKESFERIERKTTQLLVDDHILNSLRKTGDVTKGCQGHVEEFKQYIANKRQDELKLKYTNPKGKALNPDYLYLKNRLTAIEGAVKHFLGASELKKMEALFEEEFTRRILQAKDH
jgi:hypothetical protein